MTNGFIFHVIFQKNNKDKMDIDVSDLNEIDIIELTVEISSDYDMQIVCV